MKHLGGKGWKLPLVRMICTAPTGAPELLITAYRRTLGSQSDEQCKAGGPRNVRLFVALHIVFLRVDAKHLGKQFAFANSMVMP